MALQLIKHQYDMDVKYCSSYYQGMVLPNNKAISYKIQSPLLIQIEDKLLLEQQSKKIKIRD